jgi:MoxR-like ATPase
MTILELGNNQFLAPVDLTNDVPQYVLARGRVGVFDTSLPSGETLIAPEDVLQQIRDLEADLNDRFVAMSDPIHALMLGLATGENVFMLSLPGAAKSAIGRLIGGAVGGRFFRRNMTPSTTESDLLGPISLAGVKNEKYTRAWSGVATAHVAMLDEWFKGSGATRTMLLDAAAEHTVSDADGEHPIPLLLMIAASNELVDPSPGNADWDRFLLRIEAPYPHLPGAITQLFNKMGERKPIAQNIDPEALVLLQAYIEWCSYSIDPAVVQAIEEIVLQLAQNEVLISPRRVLGAGRAAVAEAMLTAGQMPDPEHLEVLRHIFWIKPEDRDTVAKSIAGFASPEKMLLMSVRADIEDFQARKLSMSMGELTQTAAMFKGYIAELGQRIPDGGRYAANRDELVDLLRNLSFEMLDLITGAGQGG